jgi:starch-binding outer membrane protein, SusD/RagB family
MYNHKIMKKRLLIASLVLMAAVGCTKLNPTLNSSLTSTQAANALGANGVGLLLQAAYFDIGSPYSDPGNFFALQEVSTDECLVPTRGGDWDDNGKWRALQFHDYTTDEVNEFNDQFNAFNKMNFDATNVLNFAPSAEQAAEARFIRALALYNLLDLYNQFPFRDPGDNLLNAPKVYTGDSAVNFIINELNEVLPDLNPANGPTLANADAAKLLLMRCYLNRGAFNAKGKEPYTPTFDDADMQQVITIGQSITARSYTTNYFDNFSPNNDASPEVIFSVPNIEGASTNPAGINNYWWATLHYDQYPAFSAQASGWNGFSTVAQTYNLFSAADAATTYGPSDTLLKDQRIGGKYYAGSTNVAGVSPGFLINQQYDQNHNKYFDRKGNLLKFDPVISPDLKETGSNLEVTGIRIIKYPPDYNQSGKFYGNPLAGNDCVIFRYSDVVLMIAEAKMRLSTPDNAGALILVNQVRAARGANPLTNTMTLVNPADVYDPNTLLAERGREFYWENVRRTDLCRFGMFNAKAAYHGADPDSHTNLYPLPSAALASNPNLKQNPGYPDK